MNDMRHMDFIDAVARDDLAELRHKEATYQGSWKRRGGVGAFMMLARKWDRLEGMAQSPPTMTYQEVTRTASAYDIFGLIKSDPSGNDGSALAEIRDLRRYLLLVEAEMVASGVVAIEVHTSKSPIFAAPFGDDLLKPGDFATSLEVPGTPEDGGHHATEPRMEDGETELPPWFTLQFTNPNGGKLYYNVDRTAYPPNAVDHLPRLQPEMNHKEYCNARPWYQPMYYWVDAESKWKLSPTYRELWGHET